MAHPSSYARIAPVLELKGDEMIQLDWCLLLTQVTGDSGSGNETAPQGGLMQMLPMFLVIFAIFYFIAWRPQAKERRNREAMLKAIKSGDRVMMTSGMIGTIAGVKENEVTVKVDEKNNVKLRFSRAAVQSVLGDPKEQSSESK